MGEVALVDGAVRGFEFGLAGTAHDLEKQLFLRSEVVVEGRLGAADARADFRHRRALEAEFAECLRSLVEDGFPVCFRFRLHRGVKNKTELSGSILAWACYN